MANQKYTLTLAGEDKASGPLKNIGAAAGALTGKYRELESRKNNLDSLHKDVVGYQKNQNALVGLTKDLAAAKRETEKLAREMASGTGVTRKQQRAFEQSHKRVKSLKKQTIAFTQAGHKLGNELKAAGIDTKRLADEQRRLERVAGGATRKV